MAKRSCLLDVLTDLFDRTHVTSHAVCKSMYASKQHHDSMYASWGHLRVTPSAPAVGGPWRLNRESEDSRLHGPLAPQGLLAAVAPAV